MPRAFTGCEHTLPKRRRDCAGCGHALPKRRFLWKEWRKGAGPVCKDCSRPQIELKIAEQKLKMGKP
jgi:hypothetical protein